jgi:hypothetical protein
MEMLLEASKTGVVVSAVDADGAPQDQVGSTHHAKKDLDSRPRLDVVIT